MDAFDILKEAFDVHQYTMQADTLLAKVTGGSTSIGTLKRLQTVEGYEHTAHARRLFAIAEQQSTGRCDIANRIYDLGVESIDALPVVSIMSPYMQAIECMLAKKRNDNIHMLKHARDISCLKEVFYILSSMDSTEYKQGMMRVCDRGVNYDPISTLGHLARLTQLTKAITHIRAVFESDFVQKVVSPEGVADASLSGTVLQAFKAAFEEHVAPILSGFNIGYVLDISQPQILVIEPYLDFRTSLETPSEVSMTSLAEVNFSEIKMYYTKLCTLESSFKDLTEYCHQPDLVMFKQLAEKSTDENLAVQIDQTLPGHLATYMKLFHAVTIELAPTVGMILDRMDHSISELVSIRNAFRTL